MIEVDIAQLLTKLNELQSIYSSIEENQLNLFSSLSMICNTDWYDANSIAFDKEAYKDKTEAEQFKNYILSRISLVEYISNQYSALAKKVKCNLSGKSAVLDLLDDCISTLSVINDEFEKIDMAFYYPELYTIRAKKIVCKEKKEELESIKEEFSDLYSKVEGIEEEIGKKIVGLEEFKIETFKYSFGQNYESISGAHLDFGLFEQDRSKIMLYSKEENNNYDSVYKLLGDFSNCYKSSNVSKFVQVLSNFKSCYNSLHDKRKAYITALDQVPPVYGMMVTEVKQNFGGDV